MILYLCAGSLKRKKINKMRIFINENFYDVTKEFVGIHIDIMNHIDKKYGIKKLMNDFADSYKKISEQSDNPTSQLKELKDKFLLDFTKAFSNIKVSSFDVMIDAYGDIDSVKQQYPFTWKMLMEKWNNKHGHGTHNEMGFFILFKYGTEDYASWSDYYRVIKYYFSIDVVDRIINSLSYGYYYESLSFSFQSTIIHELRHAYDSFQSNYKYASDKKSEKYYDKLISLEIKKPDDSTYKILEKELKEIYYTLPHEYWARLAEYVQNNEYILSAEYFKHILNNAMNDENLKLKEIPKKDQRKIINKLRSINIKIFNNELLEKLNNINSPDGFFSDYYNMSIVYSFDEIYKDLVDKFYNFKYFNKEQMDFLRKSYLDFKKKYKQQKNI